MACFQFVTTAGDTYIQRTTNLPGAANSWATSYWMQVTTYADYLEPWSINDISGGRYAGLEGLSSGTVYAFVGDPFTTVDLWTDSRTSWMYVAQSAISTGGSNWTLNTYTMTAAGVWTAHTAITNQTVNWTPDSVTWNTNPTFPTDANGTIRFAAKKLWGATKSEATLRAEARSNFPRDLNNLLFWNPGLPGVAVNIDLSGRGGNFTLAGTPTANSSDPGVPYNRRWQQ